MIALIIAFVMAFSLMACGGDKKETEEAMTDIQEQDDVAEEEPVEEEPEEESVTEEETEEPVADDMEPSVEFVEPPAEDFEYNYDAAYGGLMITAYNGDAEAIRIPAELDGEPVKQVKLTNNHVLTRVELPESIEVIGDDNAFHGCTSLIEITIPDSVETIGEYAFALCTSLRNLTIPDNTYVVRKAFRGCEGLTVIYQGQEYNYANDPGKWW